jgi:thiosulfate/3-mercaptopyruvate sulfurtransferase
MYSTLISVADLAAHLADPAWVIVDCRFDLARPEAGREAYASAHIPGARYAHLDQHLSCRPTPQSGRHPLPDADTLAATLGSWGIGNATQVVAYDAGNGAYAARLWWLMRWLGAERVAVLDGGFRSWTDAGLPVTAALPDITPTRFAGNPRPEMLVHADEVLQRASDTSWRVLDARAPERFRGELEPLDPVAGHIPGAGNHPFTDNLAADGRFLPVAELRQRLQASLHPVRADRSIAMCGSGVTACHNLLALEAAGLQGARLYAGSWSEWIRDPSRPVAVGPEPGNDKRTP